jgi:hypothetical protein
VNAYEKFTRSSWGDAAVIALAFVAAVVFIAVAVHNIKLSEEGYKLHRIDWDKVPVEIYRVPPKRTENQLTFDRERKRVYLALEFERKPRSTHDENSTSTLRP